MDGLKQIKALGVTLGVVMIVLGLILLIFPDVIINILATVIGALVAAYGGFRTIAAVVSRDEAEHPVLKIAFSALLLVCGVYILFHTSITISFISVVIGLFAVLFALDRFSMARVRRKAQLPVGSTVGFGVIHLLFGATMICMPLTGTSMLLMLAGIYMIAGGAMILASACWFGDF